MDDGFRGFWHEQRPRLNTPYRYKYSGGLGTYCHSHQPFSVYCPEVHQTFFCWGGTSRAWEEQRSLPRFDWGEGMLLHQVGVYDHHAKKVHRPVILLDKWCGDAHDNPVISVDPEGYLWVFSPSHANWTTPSYIHKSKKPFSTTGGFEKITEGLFAYPQAFWERETGLNLFHVQYLEGRALRLISSPDGRHWSHPKALALIGEGSYQIAHVEGRHLAIIFDHHPAGRGVDGRTNLYYMESFDGGENWQNAFGKPLVLPLTAVDNPALVLEALSQDLLVYVKDLQFDAKGKP
ncbi:MAG: BNR-4 repeat-containing protein, partial [Spirochaetia bacterium]|nr:BNR-4 repeat-containing protein [Spirochaetia bacterium]